jgi:hypothetical protein
MKKISEGQIRELMECATPGCICHTHRHNTHCPAHADRNPSFSVGTKGDSILVHCFSGCDQKALWLAVLRVASPRGRGGLHVLR